MGLRPGGTGLRPGGGSGLRPGGAPLGGGAGAGGGGAGGGGSGSGAPSGAAAGLPQCNPARPGAPAVPKEFLPIGQKDESGRMIYSKNDLMAYSGLTERWDLNFGGFGGGSFFSLFRRGTGVSRYRSAFTSQGHGAARNGEPSKFAWAVAEICRRFVGDLSASVANKSWEHHRFSLAHACSRHRQPPPYHASVS